MKTHTGTAFRLTDILIPSSVGTGQAKAAALRRTIIVYATLYLLGVYAFYNISNPKLRAAGLGLVFPGAGFLAIATTLPIICFAVNLIIFISSLVLWLACGAVLFPILSWLGSAALAGILAKGDLWSATGTGAVLIPLAVIAWLLFLSRAKSMEATQRRQSYNWHLTDYIQRYPDEAAAPVRPGTRELDPRTLRFVQWFIETGLLPSGDWSRHTIVDQFQTAALRYQLYQTVYSLQAYQCCYAPNYSGALGEACRNALRKAQCEKVNSFWKWECIWGKLNFHDWNPVKKDNIMVTGYFGLAVALYEANTRDYCFRESDCMEFTVTKRHVYKTNFMGIINSVFQNMARSIYTLYPCEPHWIYSACNLFGINGLAVADRCLQTDLSSKLRSDFERSLHENFSDPDGSIVPIHSTMTGFAIPGSIGIAGSCMASVLCSSILPHVGHRCWALVRKEAVRYEEDGTLRLLLHGGDKIDPGNYRKTEGVSRVLCGQAAAEYGDYKVRDECLQQLDTVYHPAEKTSTGSLYNRGLSVFMQGRALEARLWATQDWANMITNGVPEICFEGPLLKSIPFPEVLVAKAWSHDGVGLDLVLYNGLGAGEFELQFSRMRPQSRYHVNNERVLVADIEGCACLSVNIDGRTTVALSLMETPPSAL